MSFKRKEPRLETALENEGPLDNWERGLLEQVVTANLAESRRARRWGVFFKLATLAYVAVLLFLLFPPDFMATVKSTEEHTALVDVKGVIAPSTKAAADEIVKGLRNAFEDKKTKAVILRINSPGGSPVQSGYVYNEIKRLRKKHEDIPVYAVIADMGASGAYYIAAAADAIYADKASLVGSIGVLMNGFGFVQAMDELGIERRLLTAGDNKAIMDPFSPVGEGDAAHMQQLLDKIHRQFITAVKEGRKGKLQDNPEIFSGLFWTGEESLQLGLVDGLGSSGYVAREVVGVEEIVDFTAKEDWMKRLSERLGTGIGRSLAASLGLDGAPELR